MTDTVYLFWSPIQILASAGGALSGGLRGLSGGLVGLSGGLIGLSGGLSGLAGAFGGGTIPRRSQTNGGEVRVSLK